MHVTLEVKLKGLGFNRTFAVRGYEEDILIQEDQSYTRVFIQGRETFVVPTSEIRYINYAND